jgi:DNA-binding MarR family transcriptional regulator
MEARQSNQDINQIFGMVFLLAQRWQMMGDRELKATGITTKQWMVLVSIQNLFEAPPSVSELANAMGSSRQNVKQLALNLEKKGFLEIIPDAKDLRIQRFVLTKKNEAFWAARQEQDQAFIKTLFQDLDAKQIAGTREAIEQMVTTTDVLIVMP